MLWAFPETPRKSPHREAISNTATWGRGTSGKLARMHVVDGTRGGPFSDTGTTGRPFEHEECRDGQPDYSQSGLILAWTGWEGMGMGMGG